MGAWVGFIEPWAHNYLRIALNQLKERLEALRFVAARKRVFFCYRRRHDQYAGGRIVEALANEFGADAIFRDVDSVQGGSFEDRISKAIDMCSVMVVFISSASWFEELGRAKGTDYVRREVEHGLRAKDRIRMIPVIVQDALPEGQNPEQAFGALDETLRELRTQQ